MVEVRGYTKSSTLFEAESFKIVYFYFHRSRTLKVLAGVHCII